MAKYLLVNPPVDLAYAIKKLDEWNALEGKFGQDKSQELVSKALAIVDSFADERRDDQAVFDRLVKSSPASLEALIYLIWSAFISRIKYLTSKPSSLAAAVRLPSVLCNVFTINSLRAAFMAYR